MSKRYKPNPLLDSMLELDFTLFANMKLSNVECWEQIVMQAAIYDIEIDKNLIKFLIVMAYHYDNILNAMSEAIINNRILEQFDSDLEAIETIYKLLDNRTLNSEQMFKAISEYNEKSNDSKIDMYFYTGDPTKLDIWKVKLLSAVESKYPLLLVKFYDKWKRILHQQDMPFVIFMKNKLSERAKTDDRFNRIIAAVDSEFVKQQNITMFMS